MWCWEAGWLGSEGRAGDASQSFCPEQGVSTPPPRPPSPPSYTHTRGATWLYFQNQEPLSPSLWAQYGQQAITELTSRRRCSSWQWGWCWAALMTAGMMLTRTIKKLVRFSFNPPLTYHGARALSWRTEGASSTSTHPPDMLSRFLCA